MKNHEIFNKWIEDNCYTLVVVATKLGKLIKGDVTPQNIYAWRVGRCNPSKALRPAVEKLTRGKCKANNWKPWGPRRK